MQELVKADHNFKKYITNMYSYLPPIDPVVLVLRTK